MLAVTTRTSLRVISRAPIAQAAAARYLTSMEDSLKGKGSVEEANYIREQEKIFFAKKKADMANKMVAADEKIYKEQIAPAMAEAESVLKPIGATLSRDGLEAIAKWKLGL